MSIAGLFLFSSYPPFVLRKQTLQERIDELQSEVGQARASHDAATSPHPDGTEAETALAELQGDLHAQVCIGHTPKRTRPFT